jgi:reverse gyrase
MMSKKLEARNNSGIIAEAVTSDVLAVGKNATAVQYLSAVDIQEFVAHVAELKRAIDGIDMPENAKVAISKEVSKLEEETHKRVPDKNRIETLLKSLLSSTKMLSEFVSSASIVFGPIAKIAGLFGLAIG